MVNDGYLNYTEVGPGKVLQGLIKKLMRGFYRISFRLKIYLFYQIYSNLFKT